MLADTQNGRQAAIFDPNETVTDWIEPGAKFNILAKFDQKSQMLQDIVNGCKHWMLGGILDPSETMTE